YGGVDLERGRADRREVRHRVIAGCLYDEMAAAVETATLADRYVRVVDRDCRRVVERFVDVTDHADDGVERSLRATLRRDPFADRVLARPELLRERATHDDGAAVGITVVERCQRASAEHGDTQRFEVPVAGGALSCAQCAL